VFSQGEYLGDIFFSGFPDSFGPFNKLLRSPVALVFVFGGQVILYRSKRERPAVAFVGGNMLIPLINIYLALAVKKANLFTDVPVRHTVIMLVLTQAYVIVL